VAEEFNPADYFSLLGIGNPESVLKRKFSTFTYLQEINGYYEPPTNPIELALILEEGAHPYLNLVHEYETDKILEFFVDNIFAQYNSLTPSIISKWDFKQIVQDYQLSGYAFYLKNRNILGKVTATSDGKPAVSHLPFAYMRVMADGNYCQLNTYQQIIAIYRKEDVGMIRNASMIQNVYGRSPYRGLIQSAMLGEDALLTMRRELTSGITRKIISFLGLTNDQLKNVIDNFKLSKGHKEMTAFLGLPDKDQKRIDDVMKVYPDDSAFKIDFGKIFRDTAEILVETRQIPWFMIGATPDQGSTGLDMDKVERIHARRILSLMSPFEQINHDVPGAVNFFKKTLIDLIKQPVAN
jgi:hypothetical protein